MPAALLEDLAVVQAAYVQTAGNSSIVRSAVVHDLIGNTPEGYQPPGEAVRGGEFAGPLSEPDEFGNRYGGTTLDGTPWVGPRGVPRTM